MSRMRVLLVLGFFLALLSMAGDASAAPAPPMVAVIHETRECGMMPGGDECTDCYPTGGWVQLGDGFEVECPEGYTNGEPEYACDPFKTPHCCTEGHSGAAGDREDMIISHRHDQCAFVDDIEGCKPPREWTRQPNGRRAQDWLCPADYEWVGNLDCTGEESDDSAGGVSIPCLGTSLVAPALLIVWLVIKRNA